VISAIEELSNFLFGNENFILNVLIICIGLLLWILWILFYATLGFLASCIYVIYRVIFHRESIRDAISILREDAFLDNPGMPSGGISDYGYDDRDKYS